MDRGARTAAVALALAGLVVWAEVVMPAQATGGDGSPRPADTGAMVSQDCTPAMTAVIPAAPTAADPGENDPPPGASSYTPTAVHISEQRPRLPLGDYLVRDDEDAVVQAFKDHVDSAFPGDPETAWDFEPADAVIQYARTGELKYLDLAIKLVDEMVADAEARIADDEAPAVAGDDYLEAGQVIEQVALTMDYGHDRILAQAGPLPDGTEAARLAAWERFGDQLVANIWSPTQATWGDEPTGTYPWSAWSINDPGNNYHYSFMMATMLWAVARCNLEWVALLQDIKFPNATNYYEQLIGGGTREGTGYGVAQRRVFENARRWAAATGEHLPAFEDLALQTIDYWINATTPDGAAYAPFGDLSRESFPSRYDYHDNLVREAAMSAASTPEADRAAWWLANSPIPATMTHSFNLREALLAPSGTPAAPTELTYHAQGVGHLFTRTSWTDPTASWMATTAGPKDQSHAHEDQGSFSFYDEGFLTVTENIWSHSGLQGNTAYGDENLGAKAHNIIRFVKDGQPADQRDGGLSTLTTTIGDGSTRVHENLKPAYGAGTGVQAWTRDLTFSEEQLRVEDICAVGAGVTPVWQLQVPNKPESIDSLTIVAGNLQVSLDQPYESTFVSYKALDEQEFPGGGWRIDLRSPDGCAFGVTLNKLAAVDPPVNTTFDRVPPPRGHKRRVVFKFHANTPMATFRCSIDGKAFRPCSSPQAMRLGFGQHRFRVRATKPDGTKEVTPATYKFKILR